MLEPLFDNTAKSRLNARLFVKAILTIVASAVMATVSAAVSAVSFETYEQLGSYPPGAELVVLPAVVVGDADCRMPKGRARVSRRPGGSCLPACYPIKRSPGCLAYSAGVGAQPTAPAIGLSCPHVLRLPRYREQQRPSRRSAYPGDGLAPS